VSPGAVLRHLAEVTAVHLVVPAGLYREAFTPLSSRDECRGIDRRGAVVVGHTVGSAEWRSRNTLADYTFCSSRLVRPLAARRPLSGGIRGYIALVEEFIPALSK